MRLGYLRKRLAVLKPPFKAGLRTQLTILVCIIALSSLIILACTTGVYFTSNYRTLRADRLHVAARLMSSQVDQSLTLLYYQCNMLSTKDTIQNALSDYRAGNRSAENWIEADKILGGFLERSKTFYIAYLYDEMYQEVLSRWNNDTEGSLAEESLVRLRPLEMDKYEYNEALDVQVETLPYNKTLNLMSMTLPVEASTIIGRGNVVGFLTIVMSADPITAVNDTSVLGESMVSILTGIPNDKGNLVKYRFVFPPGETDRSVTETEYPIKNASFLRDAFLNRSDNYVTSTSSFYHFGALGHDFKKVAVGYSACKFRQLDWVAVVSQDESVFLSPAFKLTKIIIGTVLGVAVFMCIVTFILASWAVKPIVRLQKATEFIAAGRGLRTYNHSGRSSSQNTSIDRSNSRGSDHSLPRELFEKKHHVSPFVTENHAANSGSCSSMSDHERYLHHIARYHDGETSTNILSDHEKGSTSATNWIDTRVPVYRRLFTDELSELTDTFNTMTDELDRQYVVLEDRVRARTKQLEAAKIQAEAANEAKTVFIANISHELRTPLNGILGMTAIAMAEQDQEKIQNSLKLIFRSGELLLHILTELLTFSKNVLKRTKLEERHFSIIDIALQVKSIFGKLAKDQHVKLSIYLMPNAIRTMVLWGDSNRIIQIVMNLVSNALKFTPVDGKVDVRIKLVGEYDSARSEACNFSEVYILPGTEVTNSSVNNIPTVVEEEEKACEEEPTADDTPERKKKDSETVDDADAISISSSVATSYDDAVLHAQLKKIPTFIDLEDSDNNVTMSKLEKPRSWVIVIEVQDTGPGIEPSLHESVFKPFVQGDQTLSRQYGGTGLGLSICRQLATMMKGTMKLESKVGSGSKFTFTVPLQQTGTVKFNDGDTLFEDEFNIFSKKNRKVKFQLNRSGKSRKGKMNNSNGAGSIAESAIESFGKSESEASFGSVRVDRPFLQSTGTATSTRSVPTLSSAESSLRILVAEDNNVNQEVIKRMLHLEGAHNIDLACDGEDAYQKVSALVEQGEHYDLIFMDVQMPRMDGLLTTKLLRQKLHYEYPIVALTAFADDSNIKECLESGMNSFLAKPIKRPMLKKILLEHTSQLKT
ncbi:AFR284Wp [Eremothecium gossypii ATCC 10895]|uniref:histidine kinase n=1 Tax=Eremothecium gossypii (strain ATCC 10895 / CBS 109.51 / FGSC 9923 / NRRL Y-1056) TaxID=284811 RepID=Q753M8_EREGS|nr:AFR284Wp [Eremothecium gossypii ATCC 10895]AAS53655.2 AFR284Wp [Eremothecium gossypii ATCC 10895]AEY97968.1 FAFR284Wp [Eremothecium gossypii FDAG1]